MLVWICFFIQISRKVNGRMKKYLCCIFNYAPHYRQPIYSQMAKELNCKFYFGANNDCHSNNTIRKLDLAELPGFVKEFRCFFWNRFSWMNCLGLLFHQEYDAYLLTGNYLGLHNWLFLLLAKLLHKKTYLWGHGDLGKEGRLRQLLLLRFHSLATGCFFYNQRAKERMAKNGCRNSLYTIYNSLDYMKQSRIFRSLTKSEIFVNYFHNHDPNLIFSGRLTAEKHLDELLYAMAELRRQGRNLNLSLLGDGEQTTVLKELAAELGLAKYVRFYGACYSEEVLGELYYNADLCIIPQKCGLTAIHAMTFGCPVLTEDNLPNQMPEVEAIIPGVTGNFYSRQKPSALSAAIGEWLENVQDREQIRQNCRDEVTAHWNAPKQITLLKQVFTAYRKNL